MTKRELVARVADRTGFTRRTVCRVMDSVFDSIAEAMAAGESYRVPGFGLFEPREGIRRGRHPVTRDEYTAEYRTVRFKPGREIRAKLKEGIRDAEVHNQPG